MSRCISRAGEYGDHVLADTGTAVERFVCSRCFVAAEDELFAEVDSLRAKLAAAEQERDNLDRLAADRYHEARQLRAALAAVRAVCAEINNVREYGERGSAFQAGANQLACRIERALAAAEQDEPGCLGDCGWKYCRPPCPHAGQGEPKREQS